VCTPNQCRAKPPNTGAQTPFLRVVQNAGAATSPHAQGDAAAHELFSSLEDAKAAVEQALAT
jgi:hypothetical protein